MVAHVTVSDLIWIRIISFSNVLRCVIVSYMCSLKTKGLLDCAELEFACLVPNTKPREN